jgi:hypothetical protein
MAASLREPGGTPMSAPGGESFQAVKDPGLFSQPLRAPPADGCAATVRR